MQPIEERYIDKSTWSRGEWDNEPDRVEWRFDGPPRLACLIVRSPGCGALCGYVGVPPGHPYHGKDYGDCDVSVHGGLTYADMCQEGGKICHVPLAGESPDVYWLGFDCAHSGDVRPAHGREFLEFSEPYSRYRGIYYVRSEVERLAHQLCRVAKGLPAEADDES